MEGIIYNKYKHRLTDTVLIHAGRFHSDDMMFAAMASIVIKKAGLTPKIIRTNDISGYSGDNIIVGDIGMGIYDHHVYEDNVSLGAQLNTEEYMVAACGLLYNDIKSYLFDGISETRYVFEALLNIIEHCDNTADNNTFSDSINLLMPTNPSEVEAASEVAINYCKDIINGFIEAHRKEKSGKIWAIPKTNNKVLPGVVEKLDTRYRKASASSRAKYSYVSYNDKTDMKLRSMNTYSLANSVLTQHQRTKWKEILEASDKKNINELTIREERDWPVAVANMKNRTIILDSFIPWVKFAKDINALFIIEESQRGGYSITPVKTNTGVYRCPPELITTAAGCYYIANDKRFLLFETKEDAINAAYSISNSIDEYLYNNGINGYRDIYGGIRPDYSGEILKDVISEDIALRAFVRDNVNDLNNLTRENIVLLQLAVRNNPYAIHCLCHHLKPVDDAHCIWEEDVNVINCLMQNKTPKNTLQNIDLNATPNVNIMWDSGLNDYLETEDCTELYLKAWGKNAFESEPEQYI